MMDFGVAWRFFFSSLILQCRSPLSAQADIDMCDAQVDVRFVPKADSCTAISMMKRKLPQPKSSHGRNATACGHAGAAIRRYASSRTRPVAISYTAPTTLIRPSAARARPSGNSWN